MPKYKDSVLNLGIFNLLKFFQLKQNQMVVYSLLTKKSMTIRQLQKNTKMSERSLRTHLDDLVGKNFVARKLVESKRLKYVYYANSGENLLDILKRRIDQLEKSRLQRREEIIRGAEASMQK